MKDIIFTGSGVAIVTPFNPDLSVNYDKLGELIEFQLQNKTDAIIICGTTGESSTLTDDEHKECIKYAVKKVAKRVPVIAGTGSNDTAYAIELSKHAEAAGADALLVVTPYYNKCSQNGLVKHFEAVANAVTLPIIVYNVPSRTALNIAPDTYVELSKIKNIVATKEACSNIGDIAKTASLCGDNLKIYSGNDQEIIPIMSLGGIGVISVLANIMPKETHDICELYLNGKIKESCQLQLKLLELMNNLFIEVNPIPIKAAMNLMGLDVGGYRLPLCDMSDKNLAILKESLIKEKLI